MKKEEVEKEVELLHKEYENEGGKFLKPSFLYVFELMTFGPHDGDYYVSNDLAEIQDKALELIDLGDFGTIFEVVRADYGYVCEERYKLDHYRKQIVESKRFAFEKPMHVAWRTRGDCLNE